MPITKIAVIDDRDDLRKLVSSVIDDAITNLDLKNIWSVIESQPLDKLELYPSWVNKENVGILIVDERLGEVPNESGKVARYRGTDLVTLLRKQFKEMPIYGVTSFPDDPSLSLKEHFALFTEVVRREDFTARAPQYVSRFLRMHENFLDANEKELAELSSLSRKIALGRANNTEKKRAKAIQRDLEIPIVTTTMSSREEWLEEYQKVIDEFKGAQKEANKFLKKKKGAKKKK